MLIHQPNPLVRIGRAALVAVLFVGTACRSKQEAVASPPPAKVLGQPSSPDLGYPAASWRLTGEQIEDTVLSASHILIAHKGSASPLSEQHITVMASSRSRAEALQLAQTVWQEAQKDANRFEALARQYSDDRTTRPWGGWFGIVRGDQLLPPIVDALAVIRVGEVSKVIETPFGFHIVRRLQVPPAEQVSYSRIVIKHRGAFGRVRKGRDVTRTVPDAQQIAEQVAAKAKANPQEFEGLVEEFSDAYDAVSAGDFGEWSTYESGNTPLTRSIAATLKVGEVSAPIDGFHGYEIIKRTASRPRPMLAASRIIIGHVETPSWAVEAPIERSREDALSRARKLADDLAASPQQFDSRRDQCETQACGDDEPWQSGRGDPDIEAVVKGLKPGEIARDPIDGELGYYVVRANDPSAYVYPADHPKNRKLRFEVPTARPLTADDYMNTLDSDVLADLMLDLDTHVTSELRIDDERTHKMHAIATKLSQACRTAPIEERPGLFSSSHDEVAKLLKVDEMRKYEAIVATWIQDKIRGY